VGGIFKSPAMKTHWVVGMTAWRLCLKKEELTQQIIAVQADFPEVKFELFSNMMNFSSSLLSQSFHINLLI
jgi:hypothetical protein